MSMRLYLKNTELFEGQIIEISSLQHYNYLINVLRASVGYKLKIFNEIYGEFSAEITNITKKTCFLKLGNIARSIAIDYEPEDFCLAFAIIKPKRLEMLIDMATQLGVKKFQPLISKNVSIHKLNYEKIENWIIESTEQSNRISPPTVKPIMGIQDFLIKNQNNFIYANEKEQNSNFTFMLKAQKAPTNLLVGPEGGWTQEELNLMKEYAGYSVTLGLNILRAETAVAAIISQYLLMLSIK